VSAFFSYLIVRADSHFAAILSFIVGSGLR
jgi:hypothetical protein